MELILGRLNMFPVLAFGNEQYKDYNEETGFAHIYVKSLSDVKMVFF